MTDAASPAPPKAGRRVVIAVLVALALLAGTLFLLRPAPGPLDAVPEASLLVVDANLRDLRESKLWADTEHFLRGSVPLDKLDAACGFATLSRLERFVLTIGQGEAGGVGIALAGSLAKEELLHCQTQLMIGAVGVTKNQLANATTHGGFHLTQLRLADIDLVLGLGLRRPFLVATPQWIEHMADTADAPDKSSYARLFSSAPLLPSPHRELRERLERDATGLPLLLAASVKLPSGQGQTVAALSQFLPTRELVERAKQIGEPKGAAASLTSYDGGKRATVRVVIDAGNAAAAAATKDVLLGARLAYSQNMMLRIAGAGKLLDTIKVDTHDAWVVATLDDTVEALSEHLSKLNALRGMSR